jgi:hypothetical protein
MQTTRFFLVAATTLAVLLAGCGGGDDGGGGGGGGGGYATPADGLPGPAAAPAPLASTELGAASAEPTTLF